MTAADLRIGYFAQHQLEQLQLGANPLQHLLTLDPRAEEQKLRDFLGGFGFVGDRVKEPVELFSGGEKARLVLALLVYQRPNLLLMDEPTNHLDLEMRHALTMALQEFAGAMVIVSHDRSLLSSVTDRLLLVADANVIEYDGDLQDYARWLAQRRGETAGQASEPAVIDAAHTATARREQRRTQAQQRKTLQPLKKALAQVEQRIEQINAEKAELERQLADSAVYQDSAKDRLRQLLARQREIQQGLSEMEMQWLDLSEQLETAQDGLS
jgi:ATP-binding cassette subfamily F protein 3